MLMKIMTQRTKMHSDYKGSDTDTGLSKNIDWFNYTNWSYRHVVAYTEILKKEYNETVIYSVFHKISFFQRCHTAKHQWVLDGPARGFLGCSLH